MSETEQAALAGKHDGYGPWSHTELLLATVADALHVLIWQNTQVHGKKKHRPPKPIPRPGVARAIGSETAGHRVNDGRTATAAGITYLSELRERRRRERGG